jgi:hypothetical protein
MNPLNGSGPLSGFSLSDLIRRKPFTDEEVQTRAHESLELLTNAASPEKKKKIAEKYLAKMEKSAENPAVKELAATTGTISLPLGAEISSAIAAAALGMMAQPLALPLYQLLSAIAAQTAESCPSEESKKEVEKVFADAVDRALPDGGAKALAHTLGMLPPGISSGLQADLHSARFSLLADPATTAEEGLLGLAKTAAESGAPEQEKAAATGFFLNEYRKRADNNEKKLRAEAALNFKGSHAYQSEMAAMKSAIKSLCSPAASAPAGHVELMLAGDGIAAMSYLESSTLKAEVAGAYLDMIARKTSDRDVSRFAGTAAAISSSDFTFKTGDGDRVFRENYGSAAADAAEKALGKINAGPLGRSDEALLDYGRELIASASDTTQATLVTRKLVRELAAGSSDGKLRTLASAASGIQSIPDCSPLSEYICNKAVFNSEHHRKNTDSAAQLLASVALNLLNTVENARELEKEKKPQIARDISQAFLAGMAGLSEDSRAQSLGKFLDALAQDSRTSRHELTAFFQKEVMKELSADSPAPIEELLRRFLGIAAERTISSEDDDTLHAGQVCIMKLCEELDANAGHEGARGLAQSVQKTGSDGCAASEYLPYIARILAQAPPAASVSPESYLISCYRSLLENARKSPGGGEYGGLRIASVLLKQIADTSTDAGVKSIAGATAALDITEGSKVLETVFSLTMKTIDSGLSGEPANEIASIMKAIIDDAAPPEQKADVLKDYQEKTAGLLPDEISHALLRASLSLFEEKSHTSMSMLAATLAAHIQNPRQGLSAEKVLIDSALQGLESWNNQKDCGKDQILKGKVQLAKAYLKELSSSESPFYAAPALAALNLRASGEGEILCHEVLLEAYSSDKYSDRDSLLRASANEAMSRSRTVRQKTEAGLHFLRQIADAATDAGVKSLADATASLTISKDSRVLEIACDMTMKAINSGLSVEPAQEIACIMKAVKDDISPLDQRADALDEYQQKMKSLVSDEASQALIRVSSSLRDDKGCNRARLATADALASHILNPQPSLSTEKLLTDSMLRGLESLNSSKDYSNYQIQAGKGQLARAYFKELSASKDPCIASISRAVLGLPEAHNFDIAMKGFTEALAAFSAPLSVDVPPEIHVAELGLRLLKSVKPDEKAEVGLSFLKEIANLSGDSVIGDLAKPPLPSSAESSDVAGQCEKALAAIKSFGDEIRALDKGGGPHDEGHSAVQHEDGSVIIDGIRLDKK